MGGEGIVNNDERNTAAGLWQIHTSWLGSEVVQGFGFTHVRSHSQCPSQVTQVQCGRGEEGVSVQASKVQCPAATAADEKRLALNIYLCI